MKRSPNYLSFIEHLDELRVRIGICLACIVAAACGLYTQTDWMIDFLVKPVGHLVFTSPSEAFVMHVQLSLLAGFLFSLPVTLYHVWSFIAAGLKKPEKKHVFIYGPVSFVLFILGIVFAVLVAIPFSLQFLMSYASDSLVPMITVKSYISYVGTLILAFGIMFELPLILLFLAKIGIATPEFLAQKRRHAIVIIFIISAVITPPDVVSMMIMALPLWVLFEFGVLAVRLTVKEETKVQN
jgi:sec-independent protein translocase protein TatC